MDIFILLGILSVTRAISASPTVPSLPVSLEVKDVPQYFRLQRAVPGEETEKKVSKGVVDQTHSETFLVTRLGSREPHARASYQHLQDQVLPLDVCVVELLFSPSWFSLTSLPLNLTLNYSVSEDCEWTGEGSEVTGVLHVLSVGSPKIQKLSVGDSITVTLPDKTLLPGEVFTASISLRHNWTQPNFSLRVRCRTGLELLFARSAAPNIWAVKTEMQRGAKHHTVTGYVTHRGAAERRPPPVVALLDFLVGNVSVGSAISRKITFQLDIPGASPSATGVRGSAEVLVSDRDLRAIIPLVKSHEILNTAPLTGISQKIPVRVLAMEAGGSVLDVTKQAGCETPNAQIVQVSDGCDFLFVGGKETQGALGVKVEFWLERLRSSLSLSLWVPLLPLRVEVSDTNLQRIQGFGTMGGHQEEEGSERRLAADRRAQSCRTQYQRARVRFLAYFVAYSLDGSRQLTYLLGTDWLLDVSPLIRSQAVIRDSRIARLEEEGSVLVGLEPGVTSVEVRSPLSHSILGEQTILVSSETVSILELRSHLVWGISLSVNPYDIQHPGVFTVLSQSQEAAMVLKQESALCLWILFSDMSISPVTLYDPLELSLSVVSSDPSVLSVRRSVPTGSTWSLPTLVYEGPGESPVLRLSLLIPERCRDSEAPGVLSAGYMRVTFPNNSTEHGAHSTSDIIQRDSNLHTRNNDFSNANNIIPGTSDIILRSDETISEDDESPPDDIVTTPTRWGVPGLEEGLYGLLAVFSLLTLLFFFSCVAFIMRHRNKSAPDCPGNPEAPNWVWLEGPEGDVSRNQGGGVGEEEEDEGCHWDGMDRGPQSLTSTFHPVRNAQGPEASIGLQQDTQSFSTPTSHSRALLESKRPEATPFQIAASQETERKMARMPDDPSVRSILVASEEDIMWVCKDMGMREPQEILSYMERIRGDTPPLGDRRREGQRGRGKDVVGTSVRRLT
uniref:Transmembrane protein 132D-like n=1 Tax=Leptobrachium leishanense TaxID=445787 RepID=A0A8C5WF66_9ANUR